MSDKIKKTDPLLDDDQGEEASDNKSVKQAKSENSTAAKIEKTKSQLLKEEAVSKFPGDSVAQTKYILDNSEHINFMVPQVEGEIGEETVQINGYKLTIKKNVMVNIPVQVAKILAEKYRIALEAGKEKRIDRANDVSEALG
jgi:hypothetical protein